MSKPFALPAAGTRANLRGWLWTGAKILFGTALFVIVATQTTLQQVASVFASLQPSWLLLAGLAFFAGMWFQARRYWVLVGKQAEFWEVLRVAIVQTALGNLVATSAGAAAYVFLMRERSHIRLVAGVGSLVLARASDLIVLTVVLAIASALLWDELGSIKGTAGLVLAVLVVAIIGMTSLVLWRSRFVKLLHQLSDRTGIQSKRVMARLLEGVDDIAAMDETMLRERTRAAMQYATAVNGLSLLFMVCLAKAFGLEIGIIELCFVVAVTLLLGIIPLHVMGGLGTFDLSALYLLGMMGMGVGTAAAFLLAVRLVFYGLNLLMLVYLPVSGLLAARVRLSSS